MKNIIINALWFLSFSIPVLLSGQEIPCQPDPCKWWNPKCFPVFFKKGQEVKITNPPCCPLEYYYQNTDVLPDFTFAKSITWGSDVIPYAPKGIVSITGSTPKKFYTYSYLEIQPGFEILNSGLLDIVLDCNDNFVKDNPQSIDVLSIPSYFSPNNDGLDENFVIKANSVTSVSVVIGQQIDGNIVEIPGSRKEFNVNANYIKLWDGKEGVQYGVGKNTVQFYYEFLLQNCNGRDCWRFGYITTIR